VGGTALTTIGYGLLSLVGPSTSVGQWVGYQVPFGIGCGMASTTVSSFNTLLPILSFVLSFSCTSYRTHKLTIPLLKPFIAIQNLIPAPQIPIAMGILIFTQNLGAAVFLIAAQTIFSNSLRKTIKQDAPGVNPDLIVAAGARSIRKLVQGEQLKGVLRAYSTSVDRVMYLGAGLGVASFVFCWGLGWRDIRKKEEEGESRGGGEVLVAVG
jgi:hypothetical protein